MGWALMIYPRCDALLTAGVLINILNVVWAVYAVLRWCGSGRVGPDPVVAWFNTLEDADTASVASDEDGKPSSITQGRGRGKNRTGNLDNKSSISVRRGGLGEQFGHMSVS
eukprot:862130-Pyramimonas_sp.AAC.1